MLELRTVCGKGVEERRQGVLLGGWTGEEGGKGVLMIVRLELRWGACIGDVALPAAWGFGGARRATRIFGRVSGTIGRVSGAVGGGRMIGAFAFVVGGSVTIARISGAIGRVSEVIGRASWALVCGGTVGAFALAVGGLEARGPGLGLSMGLCKRLGKLHHDRGRPRYIRYAVWKKQKQLIDDNDTLVVGFKAIVLQKSLYDHEGKLIRGEGSLSQGLAVAGV